MAGGRARLKPRHRGAHHSRGRARTHREDGPPERPGADRDGGVWVAESLEPAILRLELSGEFTRELEAVEGEPLLWPNDLCF